jgi:hypothetical protein
MGEDNREGAKSAKNIVKSRTNLAIRHGAQEGEELIPAISGSEFDFEIF